MPNSKVVYLSENLFKINMMKNLRSIMSVLLALWIVGVMPISARPRAKRVVMIALDGISVPGFTTAHTPNLDNLLAQGALSLTTRVVMPSVTLPNWTSHLTGSGPEQHGVVDNGWQIDKKDFLQWKLIKKDIILQYLR